MIILIIRLSNILKATFIVVSKKNVQEVGQITKYCRKISNKLDKLVNFVTKLRTSFGLIYALFQRLKSSLRKFLVIFECMQALDSKGSEECFLLFAKTLKHIKQYFTMFVKNQFVTVFMLDSYFVMESTYLL